MKNKSYEPHVIEEIKIFEEKMANNTFTVKDKLKYLARTSTYFGLWELETQFKSLEIDYEKAIIEELEDIDNISQKELKKYAIIIYWYKDEDYPNDDINYYMIVENDTKLQKRRGFIGYTNLRSEKKLRTITTKIFVIRNLEGISTNRGEVWEEINKRSWLNFYGKRNTKAGLDAYEGAPTKFTF